MVKNAYQQLQELGYTNYHKAAKYLNGKSIRIISNVGSHNYGPVGTVFIIKPEANSNLWSYINTPATYNTSGYIITPTIGITKVNGSISGNSLRLDEFTICGNTLEALNSIIDHNLKIVKESEAIIEDASIKIKFMKENGLEEFDELDFKVYKTLELIDNPKLSRVQMAKAIAEVIKNS